MLRSLIIRCYNNIIRNDNNNDNIANEIESINEKRIDKFLHGQGFMYAFN